jgi:U3 small nucleolar ribonucleoprotein protein LCP5
VTDNSDATISPWRNISIMAVDNSLESLLTTLTTSIQSATEALPKDHILPPKDGISLLDVKNELLLSYLQNLVFLILLKLRSRSRKDGSDNETLHPQDEVVKKLVELRVYLEKGVRPLENRLKYQIDKIVRSADDASRKSTQAAKQLQARKSKAQADSGSEASDADSDEGDEEENGISYGPRAAAISRPKSNAREKASSAPKDGIYRPPKITPVSMPTTESREQRQSRRPGKSATLDEFVATELSSAPIAQPSIGSTIVDGGRRMKSERDRKEEAERREYEESNFTRLAPQSKKELRKRGHGRDGGFGGEEWRGLGAGLDRIERLTQKKSGSMGSLQKSRKRPIDDGPRGSGSAGDAFEKRRKVVSRFKK